MPSSDDLNDSPSRSRVYFIIETHGIAQEDFKQKYEVLNIELNGKFQEYSFEATYGKTFNISIEPKGGYNSDNVIKLKLKNKYNNKITNIKLNAKLTESY